jgi:hypothetical protein
LPQARENVLYYINSMLYAIEGGPP